MVLRFVLFFILFFEYHLSASLSLNPHIDWTEIKSLFTFEIITFHNTSCKISVRYFGCIAQYKPLSLFAFSTRENGFRGIIRSTGLCFLLCSEPEGAALSNGKGACTVYEWVGVEGVIYKLTAPKAESCSEGINKDKYRS